MNNLDEQSAEPESTLEDLETKLTVHGVMLGIHDQGILLVGKSGIGKSECALDLIRRGHSLVSDDSVEIRRAGGALEGCSPELTRGLLEIRGLGIVDVQSTFGIAAFGGPRQIDLVIEFRSWADCEDIDRLGLEIQYENYLDVEVSKFVVPVSSGRNIATLVETAVKVYLLRKAGNEPVSELIKKHNEAVSGTK